MNDAWKTELRYYLRVAVTLAAALLAAKYGIKLEPPPLEVKGPVVLQLEVPTTKDR